MHWNKSGCIALHSIHSENTIDCHADHLHISETHEMCIQYMTFIRFLSSHVFCSIPHSSSKLLFHSTLFFFSSSFVIFILFVDYLWFFLESLKLYVIPYCLWISVCDVWVCVCLSCLLMYNRIQIQFDRFSTYAMLFSLNERMEEKEESITWIRLLESIPNVWNKWK